MPNQQLIDFIKNSKVAGQTDEQIESALKQSGWQDVDIEEGFKSILIPTPAQNYSDMQYGNTNANFITPETKSSKKLVIAILAIFIFLAGGAFAFYYFNKSETPSDTSIKTSKEPKEEITQAKNPKERFLEFKAALESATTYEEAANLAKQYMSKTTDTKALGYDQINLSTEQKSQLFAMLKTTPPLAKDILDIIEEISGSSGKLIMKIRDNKLCGLPIFLEDNQWKFGIMDCKESVATQPTQPTQSQNPPVNTIASCGSIKYTNIMNVDARTQTETAALNCMSTALTNCSSKALTVNRVQTTTYQIESKESQYCNISRNAGLKTTCRIPLTYISKYRERYKSPSADDIFLQTILFFIDVDGKITDGRTGQITTEFVCQ